MVLNRLGVMGLYIDPLFLEFPASVETFAINVLSKSLITG
jgi:hypothetical protein